MTFIVVFLLVSSGLFYGYFVTAARTGLRRAAGERPRATERPMVSVVVAMKNEEQNLPQLIASLRRQDYPAEMIEFILVDDGSTDATMRVASEQAVGDARVRVVSRPGSSPGSRSITGGKALALAEGIRLAHGATILCTDADCRPPVTWARAIVSVFTPDVSYVVGPVVERAPGWFGSVRALDFLGILATSAGRIGIGKPVNSFGANVAFRKSAYEQAGGFAIDKRVGDEEYLMHAIHEHGWGRVVFCADTQAKVETHVSGSLGAFWQQRLRWASMKERYPSAGILSELGVVYLFFVTLALSGILALGDPIVASWLGGMFIFKVLVDTAALRSAGKILHEHIPTAIVFLAEFLHVPYILVLVAVANSMSVEWKGRSVAR